MLASAGKFGTVHVSLSLYMHSVHNLMAANSVNIPEINPEGSVNLKIQNLPGFPSQVNSSLINIKLLMMNFHS